MTNDSTEFFDSHAHISSSEFEGNIEEVVLRAKKVGVRRILNICTDEKSTVFGLEIKKKFPGVFLAGASPPHNVEKEGEELFPIFADLVKKKQFLAVGETGLDYYYEHSNRNIQKVFLKRYLHLAWENQLPVIFHCRDAFKDLFSICDAEYGKKGGFKAILHCFTGNMSEAKEVIERGWHLSFSGIVTFKKSEELRLIAKEIPLSQILIETDAPYLAPQSKRGKMNEPSFLPEIAETIAKAKGLEIIEIAMATKENIEKLLQLQT